jgi:hypothetical protein
MAYYWAFIKIMVHIKNASGKISVHPPNYEHVFKQKEVGS